MKASAQVVESLTEGVEGRTAECQALSEREISFALGMLAGDPDVRLSMPSAASETPEEGI